MKNEFNEKQKKNRSSSSIRRRRRRRQKKKKKKKKKTEEEEEERRAFLLQVEFAPSDSDSSVSQSPFESDGTSDAFCDTNGGWLPG